LKVSVNVSVPSWVWKEVTTASDRTYDRPGDAKSISTEGSSVLRIWSSKSWVDHARTGPLMVARGRAVAADVVFEVGSVLSSGAPLHAVTAGRAPRKRTVASVVLRMSAVYPWGRRVSCHPLG
jgi:hypothetical protein